MTIQILVTTPNEKTWVKDDPVLFLGSWCLKYNRKSSWGKLDYQVEDYHWNDNRKFSQDYRYLSFLYRDVLSQCEKELNRIHNTSHSYKYWEIVIGPWLRSFVGVLYDRWYMIHRLSNKEDRIRTKVFDKSISAPQNSSDYFNLLNDDLWNHLIFAEAIQECGNIEIQKIQYAAQTVNHLKPNTESKTKKMIRKAAGLSSFLSTKNKFFFIDSYFNPVDLIRLEISLGQIPSFPISLKIPNFNNDDNLRKGINIRLDQESGSFEDFLSRLIPVLIPRCYIEGYKYISKKVERANWPSSPQVIFTCNSHIGDDFFKFWAALKVENGARLVCGQHGGHYGAGKFSMWEDHERSIADKYFSWGWTGEGVVDMPASKLTGTKKRKKHERYSNKELLIVTTSMPRYFYTLFSMPIADQFREEIESQIIFAKSLDSNIRDNMSVKLYPKDYGQCQAQRWRDQIDGISIVSNDTKLDSLMNNCRLIVCTYNATTFLESFAKNIPTILLWNSDLWEIRDSAKEDFQLLEKIGILHHDSETASRFICEIWNDVEGWWMEKDRQDIIEKFCYKYARMDHCWLSEWKKNLFL